MQKEDLIYLANNISTLCQIPVRIYRNKKLFHFYYSVDLIKDPFYLHEFELSTFEKEISYIIEDLYVDDAVDLLDELPAMLMPAP